MIEALLVVLSNPTAGRDDDFNDWYTNIHTRDVLRFRGSIAQQRFRLAAEQVQDYPGGYGASYLALYEVYDSWRFTQEHVDNALTPRMHIENSFDTSRINDFYFYPLQFRDKNPRTFQAGSVVFEQIKAKPGQEEALRGWYNDVYLPERFRQEGIITASFLAFDTYGQMLRHQPTHDHIGVWRLADDAARDLWRKSNPLRDCPFIETDGVAVTCWDICTARVTEDDAIHTSAAALAAEEATRKRMAEQGTILTRASATTRSIRD